MNLASRIDRLEKLAEERTPAAGEWLPPRILMPSPPGFDAPPPALVFFPAGRPRIAIPDADDRAPAAVAPPAGSD